MRIQVTGTSAAVTALKGNLAMAGYVVSTEGAVFSVTLHDTPAPHVILDVVDGPFARELAHEIGTLTSPILIQYAGGNVNDRHATIFVPETPPTLEAVERGVVRALEATVRAYGQRARLARVPKPDAPVPLAPPHGVGLDLSPLWRPAVIIVAELALIAGGLLAILLQ